MPSSTIEIELAQKTLLFMDVVVKRVQGRRKKSLEWSGLVSWAPLSTLVRVS